MNHSCLLPSNKQPCPEDMSAIYKIPSYILFLVGACDLVRGCMHTFLLKSSAAHFAKFNMDSVSEDQLFLLGVFGITNFLTGFVYILISLKAKHLSPHILILIPSAYLLGLVGIWSSGVHAQAEFNGRYFMFGYFFICILTYIHFLVCRKRTAASE